MCSSTSKTICLEDNLDGELDEKCSFDTELSLLESTLTDILNEQVTENIDNNSRPNTSDDLTAIIVQETPSFNTTGENKEVTNKAISLIDDNKSDISIPPIQSEKTPNLNALNSSALYSQHFKSIYVSEGLSNSLIDPDCNSLVLPSKVYSEQLNDKDINTSIVCSGAYNDKLVCVAPSYEVGLTILQSNNVGFCGSLEKDSKIINSIINNACKSNENTFSDEMIIDTTCNNSKCKDCDVHICNDSTYNIGQLDLTNVNTLDIPTNSQTIRMDNNVLSKDESGVIATTTKRQMKSNLPDISTKCMSENINCSKGNLFQNSSDNDTQKNNICGSNECFSETNLGELTKDINSTPTKSIDNSGHSKNTNNITDTYDVGPENSPKCIDLKYSNIYCSTPIGSEHLKLKLEKNNIDAVITRTYNTNKISNNLKRKLSILECIEEVDEDASDSNLLQEKKCKINDGEICDTTIIQSIKEEDGLLSSIACFETPAKSILKKWQTSFSIGSASSYCLLDETGGHIGDNQDSNVDTKAAVQDDTFEGVCDSLNEELMKSSSNIMLDRYYSKVQYENQIDGENFDKWIEELNDNLGDTTSLIPVEEESLVCTSDKTSLALISMEGCLDSMVGILPQNSDGGTEPTNDTLLLNSDSENQGLNVNTINNGNVSTNGHLSMNKSCTLNNEVQLLGQQKGDTTTDAGRSANLAGKKSPVLQDTNEDLDEEDVLLEEGLHLMTKQYEFQEFVSADPKENEDNYNPEWKKLGQLTNDEERYVQSLGYAEGTIDLPLIITTYDYTFCLGTCRCPK